MKKLLLLPILLFAIGCEAQTSSVNTQPTDPASFMTQLSDKITEIEGELNNILKTTSIYRRGCEYSPDLNGTPLMGSIECYNAQGDVFYIYWGNGNQNGTETYKEMDANGVVYATWTRNIVGGIPNPAEWLIETTPCFANAFAEGGTIIDNSDLPCTPATEPTEGYQPTPPAWLQLP